MKNLLDESLFMRGSFIDQKLILHTNFVYTTKRLNKQ